MEKLLLFFILFYSCLTFSQENWNYLPIELSNYHGALYPTDENIVHVITDGGIFYKTEDGGETWSQFDSGIDEIFLDLAFDGANNGYAVGDNGTILKTINAGENWSQLASGTTEAIISVAVNTSNNIWAVGNNGVVLHSTNGGNNWSLNTSLTSEKLNSIHFKDKNIGYIAGDNGVLFYTENGGDDWEPLSIPTTDDLFSIAITENYVNLLSGSSNIFDTFSYSGFAGYRTQNNTDWADLYFQNQDLGITDMYFLNDNKGFTINSAAALCDCCNVWIEKTNDGGDSWEYSLEEETTSANCHANEGFADIHFASEDVGYALLGGYILKTPYDAVAGVEEFNHNSFTIYPNPIMEDNFKLTFKTPEYENITLEIMDINGRKVFQTNNLKETNTLSIPQSSAAVYFVKLLKNNQTIAIKKIIKQ
ncbi:YCF48-related protein [uncultured Marixanthomonas sp.]|uniref:YCF48-related protein n=1 Tax=uncultured Marixanthomonas sp. TaxID=757245 RepID=UPI0030DD0AFF|tara:strand:+ start:27504 stop:28766 length:1263 start_codon:yes stop_codon:yes gene_type:complete